MKRLQRQRNACADSFIYVVPQCFWDNREATEKKQSCFSFIFFRCQFYVISQAKCLMLSWHRLKRLSIFHACHNEHCQRRSIAFIVNLSCIFNAVKFARETEKLDVMEANLATFSAIRGTLKNH